MRARPLVAAAAALVLAVLALSFVGGTEEAPPPAPHVEPVPAAESPAEEARNLATWLRANAEGG